MSIGDSSVREPHGAGSATLIAPLTELDREGAVAVLGRAFRDNPMNVAVVQGSPRRRLRSNLHGMRATLEAAALGDVPVLAASWADGAGPQGALVAVPPAGHPLPRPMLTTQLRCLFGQGVRVLSRWSQVQRALLDVHPVFSHWYLGVVGVEPAQQGRGLGSALLAAWLEQVDADGLPAYLETDRRELLAFYGRSGFGIDREITVFGVPIWCMLREARSASSGCRVEGA